MKVGNQWIPVIRLAINMTALTVILWLTASKFDATELKTIILAFIAGLGAEPVLQAIKGKSG